MPSEPSEPVNLDLREVRVPHIETHDHRANRAARKIDDSGDVRRHFNPDLRAGLGLACNRAFRKTDPRRSGHAPRGSKQRHERCQVVRSHVEHRSAAELVVKAGIGIPPLMTAARHERCCANRCADRP